MVSRSTLRTLQARYARLDHCRLISTEPGKRFRVAGLGIAQGASVLVLDGAMWRHHLFTHLTADKALPAVCEWDVGRIVLTQIGRTAPTHARLERAVAALCPRARPAYDGLEITV